ncbi:heterokaryon incompatibility protein-domain-containing protein [Leptodontidium sp. 2 PMI_412]|nr:heterokaryon incompatibility protein-domain-containing protein [Leptodontidium sp. 2 PMI_412]
MNFSAVRERSPESTDTEEISQRKKRQKIEIDLTIPLCMHCQELDLDAKFEMSFRDYQRVRDGTAALPKGIFKASDGSYYYKDAILVHQFKDRLSKSSDCPLCGFFRSLRVQPERHKCHKLLAFRSSHSWLFRTDILEKQENFSEEHKDTVFLAVVPDVDILPLCGYEAHWLDHDIPATGAIYRLQMDGLREADPTELLRARELEDEPNFNWVREWLNLCRNIHGNACRRQAIHEPISRSFRLIDCAKVPPVVEVHNWGIEYAALSYVWGAGPEDGIDWPKTVLDAVEVTRKLGLQYLWVDRLCINQSDPAEKDYLISRMTNIYEGADFTIVAAAGSGASHGLPGVRSTPRIPQPKYYLDSGNLLLSMLRDPRRDILESQYWTRGWTYQEGVLSNRRIVFTESQVYWECRCMTAHESVDVTLFHTYANKEDEENTDAVMADCMLTGIFKGDAYSGGCDSGQDDLVIIQDEAYRLDYGFPVHREANLRAQLRGLNEHIREFSKRKLSHDTDTIPALLGIFGMYKQTEAMRLFHGIPMWIGNIAGDVNGAQITFALSVSSWYHRTDPDHYMYVSTSCRRKSHLPSWTWAGWQGIVTWRAPPNLEHCAYMSDLIQAERLNLLWAPDISLHHPNRPGSIRLLDTHSADRLTSEAPTLIEIKSPFILDSFQRHTSESYGWDAKWYRIGRRLSCVAMSVPTTEREWTAKHNSGEFVSVLMFAGENLQNEHGTARFLTLRRVVSATDRWERVGTLYLIIPFLGKCPNNQVMFKKIPASRQSQKIVIQ